MNQPIRVIITADSEDNSCKISTRVRIELSKKFAPTISNALALAFADSTGAWLWNDKGSFVLRYSNEFQIDESDSHSDTNINEMISRYMEYGRVRLEEYQEFIQKAENEQLLWQEGGAK